MSERLLFRRQFVLTKTSVDLPDGWKCLQQGQHHLYAHPDVNVYQVSDPTSSLSLIGSIFDPAEPEKDDVSILEDLKSRVNDIKDLFQHIKRYVGRYALLYKDGRDFIIFNDPLALREIYYCTNDNRIICASQPNLIAKYAIPEIGPSIDPEFLEYYRKNLKGEKMEPESQMDWRRDIL